MNGIALNLALGSTGLALTACVTWVALALCRRRPLTGYRLTVLVLAAVLLLPLGQVVARASGSELVHPLRAWIEALRAPAPAQPAALEPIAAPTAGAAQEFDPALVALLLLGQTAEQGTGGVLPPAEPERDLGAIALRALVAVYAAGVLVFLLRTALRVARTRALVRSARPVEDRRILDLWREVSATSPLGRRTRLAISDDVESPACLGLLRPLVVLPDEGNETFDLDVLRCIFVHELVHLERRDGWVLVGEEILRALFWFHPATWWLVRELERLRELSCDLLVVRRTGTRRRYARALVAYAEWMQFGRGNRGAHVHSVPWFRSKDQLSKRIEMLMQSEPKSAPATHLLAPGVIGSLLLFLWTGQLALATSSCASTKPACENECCAVVAEQDPSDEATSASTDEDDQSDHHAVAAQEASSAETPCEEATCAEKVSTPSGHTAAHAGHPDSNAVVVLSPCGCCCGSEKCAGSGAGQHGAQAAGNGGDPHPKVVAAHGGAPAAHDPVRAGTQVVVPKSFKSCECQPGTIRLEIPQNRQGVVVVPRESQLPTLMTLDEVMARAGKARGEKDAAARQDAEHYAKMIDGQTKLKIEAALKEAQEGLRAYPDPEARLHLEQALANAKISEEAAKCLDEQTKLKIEAALKQAQEGLHVYADSGTRLQIDKALAEAKMSEELAKSLANSKLEVRRSKPLVAQLYAPEIHEPLVLRSRIAPPKEPRSADLEALEKQLAELEAKLASQRKAMEELREQLRAREPGVH